MKLNTNSEEVQCDKPFTDWFDLSVPGSAELLVLRLEFVDSFLMKKLRVSYFSMYDWAVQSGKPIIASAGDKSHLRVYMRDMFLQKFCGAQKSKIFLVTFGLASLYKATCL